MTKRCVLCEFDKGVEEHHIIKVIEYGSDYEDNLVDLCPNHHWVADFGTEADRLIIINLIKEKTGKEGSTINQNKIDHIELQIKVLEEQTFGKFTEEQWTQHKETDNFERYKGWFLGRTCSKDYSRLLNEKADKLILINKLKESLPKC